MSPSLSIYITSLLAYGVLYGLSSYASRRKSDKIADVLYKEGNEILLLKKQFSGTAILLIPVAVYFLSDPDARKLLALKFVSSWMYVWISVVILSLIAVSRNTTMQLRKIKRFHHSGMKQANLVIYFSGRIIFLFLYELFFRGVLLFSIISLAGNMVSVVITVGLYTGLHAHSSKDELIATIPFGILSSVICIWAHSIWPAVILHIAVALTAELMMAASVNKPGKLYIA